MKKNIISSLLTSTVILAFTYYVFTNLSDFQSLFEISLLVIFIVGLSKLIKFFFNGLFIQWTIEVFTKRFSLSESVYVSILSAVGNFFGPLLGGATIRAVYLKKVHKLSYSFFLSTLAGYYVILFSIYSFLGVISLLFISEDTGKSGLLLFFFLWFIFMLTMVFFRLPSRKKIKNLEKINQVIKLLDIIYQIEDGWREILKRKNLLIKLIILALLGLLVTGLTTYIEFKAIGVSIGFAALGVHTALSATSILISITPGAIGIKEGILLINSSVMGVTNDQILQVALIDRGVTFIVLAVLYIFSKQIKSRITI